MVRYESTFREVLAKLVSEKVAMLEAENKGMEISTELYKQMVGVVLADVIRDNINQEDEAVQGFADYWENSISGMVELVYNWRYEYYATNEIVIPAGETVTYEICYEREGSHDYTVAQTEYLGYYGYDNMPTFGSNLNFTGQNATIQDHGYISIAKQNYGFDLENDVKEVQLNMDVDNYYMVVKRLE